MTEDAIVAYLADGHIVKVRLAWPWRMSNATPAQRRRFEIIGSGAGVHWPDIDEDISARGMLEVAPRLPKQREAKRRGA